MVYLNQRIQVFVPELSLEELFSIPWGHHRNIIIKCQDNPAKAVFYIKQTIENVHYRQYPHTSCLKIRLRVCPYGHTLMTYLLKWTISLASVLYEWWGRRSKSPRYDYYLRNFNIPPWRRNNIYGYTDIEFIREKYNPHKTKGYATLAHPFVLYYYSIKSAQSPAH